MTRTFHRLVGESGLPPIRLHDLRHGATTLSLAAGNELRVVQALLGHASIVLTADTYTSVLPSLALQAADATAELVRSRVAGLGSRVVSRAVLMLSTSSHPNQYGNRVLSCTRSDINFVSYFCRFR